MADAYTTELHRLEKLAGAAALVAQEFERTQDPRTAQAATVLFQMINEQLTVIDKALDKIVEQAGI